MRARVTRLYSAARQENARFEALQISSVPTPRPRPASASRSPRNARCGHRERSRDNADRRDGRDRTRHAARRDRRQPRASAREMGAASRGGRRCPLRHGGFELVGSQGTSGFRLCRTTRVDYEPDLSARRWCKLYSPNQARNSGRCIAGSFVVGATTSRAARSHIYAQRRDIAGSCTGSNALDRHSRQ